MEENRKATLCQKWHEVAQKELEPPANYQKVAVLIVRWDDALDVDLNTKDEVWRFAAV